MDSGSAYTESRPLRTAFFSARQSETAQLAFQAEMGLKLNTDDLRHLAAVRDGQSVEPFFISRLIVLGLLVRTSDGGMTITDNGILELQRARDPRKT